jgi:peptidyl-prolyl cis-trans isomerase B (cyclophilin B)
MLTDYSRLDGDYAAFGWVTAGMNIVEAVAEDIPERAFKDNMGFLYESYMPLIENIKVVGNNGIPSPYKAPVPPTAEPFTPTLTIDTEGHTLHTLEMSIKNYGVVTMVLDETVAPITVQNFLKLVNSGYYNGVNITRVQPGFVAQMGQGAGTESIKGEFSSNGFKNDLSHRKGILSMARTTDKDSATDQFFIMLYTNTGLDGDYASFGWVTSGMNILEYIEDQTMFHHFTEDYNGYQMNFLKEKYQPVIEYIRVVN